MQLKDNTIKNLIEIIQRDYGVSLTKEDAETLGFSLLKMTKLSKIIEDRVSKNN